MLALHGVSKSFDGGQTWPVRGVELRVAEGELLVLLGESGCGKTTILRMINRLVEPDEGQITLDGEDCAGLDPVTLRLRIGYVIQSVGLLPHWSVSDNVATVPRLLGWPEREVSARVAELLELVGLPEADYAQRAPEQLSGGQRQRVGVARALAGRPRVMLLDEPFGALDPITRAQLQGHFLDLQRRLGLTAVMVTHDVGEALRMADRLAVMRGGRLLQVGAPAELLRAPADPYVAELLDLPVRQARALLQRAAAL